jgi:NADH-quinone oxidoreductase subunit E
MLSEAEKTEIEAELAHYPDRRAAGIEAMKVIQRHRGWVSDASLLELAEYLELPVAELDSVATFYNLIFRHPVGKHVILMCDSVSCWMMGYPQLREQLSARLHIGLGETTEDGDFTLLPTCCLGACERAPAALVDGELHAGLTSGKLDALLERYRRE